MADIDELLAKVAEGDEEAIAELKQHLAEKDSTSQKEADKLKRELKITKDKSLRDQFPRAIRAFDKGKLTLPDDLSDEALMKALREQEEYLADMGAPAGNEPPASDDSGVSGFGEPVGGKAPSPPPDSSGKLRESMEKGDSKGVLKAIHAMHNERGPGRDRLKDVWGEFEAEPHPNSKW